MSIGFWLLLAIFCDINFKDALASKVLCNRFKLAVGDGDNWAAAVVRVSGSAVGVCKLRLLAPNAAAFAIHLIEAKEKINALDKRSGIKRVEESNSSNMISPNNTDSCKLLIYDGERKQATREYRLCGPGATTAEGAGVQLFTTNITVEWRPPSPPKPDLELKLIATALYSGDRCNNESQFRCGATNMCIPTYLNCDEVRHCPGGEDEDDKYCRRWNEHPVLKVVRTYIANYEETFNFDSHETTKQSDVIMRINETEQRPNPLMDFAESLRPYSPWSYLVLGMLVCATILMFCLAWECCCKSFKPSDTPLHMPPSCMDLSATVAMTAASQQLFVSSTPPAYDPPPTYSSLFPRAFKSSPTPVPHCSHQEPPD